MKDFEFLFMILIFAGGFGVFAYLGGMAVWELLTSKQARKIASDDFRRKPGHSLFGIACMIFILVLFGSLTLSMLGLPAPIHFAR